MKKPAEDDEVSGKERKKPYPSLRKLARKSDEWHKRRGKKGKNRLQ